MDPQAAMSAEEFEAGARMRVSVLLPLPLAGPYDYVVPDFLTLKAGAYVRVPLGAREMTGVVWDLNPEGCNLDVGRLKPILGVYDVPPMPEVQRRFVDWVARYTVSAPGAVLRMALASEAALAPPRARLAYAGGGPLPERMTEARLKAIQTALDNPPLPPGALARRAGVSDAVVRGLIDAGTLLPVRLPPEERPPEPYPASSPALLSSAQSEAAAVLREAVQARRFAPILLDGVTGSGKTEVYFAAVAEALAPQGQEGGGQVLILLPEIALSVQFLSRFAAAFGCPPVEWHSDVPSAERRRSWRAVARGEAKVVVGARSALFLPYPDLRLIIVDEEHERAFKQEDGVCYHARDMAVARAMLGDIPIVLASATPSLETLANVAAGRYRRAHLPERHGAARLPAIAAIDLRRVPPERGRWLSPQLVAAIEDTLSAGEQALLFLNRRGYAPLTLCRHCGARIACPSCNSWLVEHRFRKRLACHHCGFERPIPASCPSCGEKGSLVPCGPGVERVAEEAAERFPKARLRVLSSDALQGPRALEAALDAITAGEVDLIVGTQLVAKGHNFPKLTLVGVVDADLGLEGGDLRAGERTFQLLQQVAGRAGRAERPGRALLQTYNPGHPVIEALVRNDRDGFLARESENRRLFAMPPYGKLAALIISGPDLREVETVARQLAATGPRASGLTVLGPAPAPLALLRGRHRMRLLVKAERQTDVPALLRDWVPKVKRPGRVRVAIDVDPYSFL
jgi:primosomal protein N' (replication factor Y) (superfamily II helicase)